MLEIIKNERWPNGSNNSAERKIVRGSMAGRALFAFVSKRRPQPNRIHNWWAIKKLLTLSTKPKRPLAQVHRFSLRFVQFSLRSRSTHALDSFVASTFLITRSPNGRQLMSSFAPSDYPQMPHSEACKLLNLFCDTISHHIIASQPTQSRQQWKQQTYYENLFNDAKQMLIKVVRLKSDMKERRNVDVFPSLQRRFSVNASDTLKHLNSLKQFFVIVAIRLRFLMEMKTLFRSFRRKNFLRTHLNSHSSWKSERQKIMSVWLSARRSSSFLRWRWGNTTTTSTTAEANVNMLNNDVSVGTVNAKK